MKHYLLLTICLIIGSITHAQDCYNDLLNKGIKEYNSGYYEIAKKRWQGALDCPDLTDAQRQTLKDWLLKPPPTPPSVSDLPEMVFVQGGAFKMGSNDGQSDEKPIHSVYVDNFYIGKYEITVAQFAAFIKESAYVTTAERGDSSYVYDGVSWKWKRGVFWKHGISGSLRPQSEYNHPVIHVSWHDATAYCDWLSRKTSKKYRLLTEAEWEYAARGGNRSNEYKYSGSNTIGDVAWYRDNSGSKTHTVGTKGANELGIHDMSGNVWEWCSDWYDENYYKNGVAQNPKGAQSGSLRVLRGGSWYDLDDFCRSSYRGRYDPDYRYVDGGFRLARD